MNETRSLFSRPTWMEIVLWAALLVWLLLSAHAFAQPAAKFDHVQTGFPLTGAHLRARCESCHLGGRFKGTPRQCALCHMAGTRMSMVVMPRNHLQTTQPCDTCHNTASFSGARFNHIGVAPGSCTTCHNGMMAPTKPANHIQTTAPCDTCHRTTAWTPARFNHMGVAAGTCMTCHNGSQATGKPANHVPTTQSCDVCHRTTAWTPAGFDHAGVAPGTCATCHNGTTAPGKSASHFVTTRPCDACHRTTAWTPVTTYSHLSAAYKPHNSGVTCASCHYTNSEVIPWKFAAYQPDCAGCHADRYQPHEKVTSPRINYTVLELRNCAGACHVYTDATFTTIKTTRSSHHHSTDGGF